MRRRQANDERLNGAPKTDERKASVVQAINAVREKLEGGATTELLPAPGGILHGSEEHASWLYHHAGEGVSLINSASCTNTFLNKSQEEIDAWQTNATEAKVSLELATIDLDKAIELLLQQSTKVIVCRCGLCGRLMYTSNKANFVHTCMSVRPAMRELLSQRYVEQQAAMAAAS